ncbi:hypothetical protein ACLB2K_061833 [Fragaria x ananassa]
MILSALLTSVGINLGLCLLFFTLYSILKKQPINAKVYAPRFVAAKEKEKEKESPSETEANGFNFERLLPTAGWVRRAWQPSEDQFLSATSLDAVVFMRIFVFSLRVFGFAAVIGVFVLLPINFLGTQLEVDFSDLTNKSLDSFSISNVDDGSNWSTAISHQEELLTSIHPNLSLISSQYWSVKDADKVYRTLARIKSEKDPQQRFKRDGLFGRKVDALDHYGKKLDDLEDAVRLEQSSLAGKEVSAAFVSFKSRLAAAVALHIQQGTNPTEWVTESAPEPQDVHWPFFSSSFIKRWICKLVVLVAYAAVTILYLIPVVIVQGLANLSTLETWFPFLTSILTLTVVSQVITGYLPSLILQLFLKLVPPIMIVLSSMEGYISFSQIQKGTALYRFDILLEPKKIPGLLADAVPAQASFFISYVVTSGWTSVSSELFRMIPLIFSIIKRLFSGKDGDEFEVPSIKYHSEIPRILFFGVLGITYFLLAPLILPFLLVYCCMGYLIYRNQLLNVYAPKYDTGGKFWPIVHSSTIFSLVLMHIIAIGMFGIKDLALASSLMVPLPILTLLFNEYCRKRFLPIFESYPVECLVKKDKEDQSDPSMDAFYDKLSTAYEDPALIPRRRRSTDGHNSPLLPAEV